MRRLSLLAILALFTDACVDRIVFDIGNLDDGVLVVDGGITNKPGPYIVKLFKSINVDDDLRRRQPFIAKEVVISDNEGNSEVLTTVEEGIYMTSAGGIQGKIGNSYNLSVKLIDGTTFTSAPDELRPVGNVDSIYYQFESIKPLNGPTNYGFRVFMNASGDNGTNYVRWRVTGVYKFRVFPEKHRLRDVCPPSFAIPDPVPCSGYEYDGTRLFDIPEKPCTCCVCWVNDREEKPYLNDDVIETDGGVRNLEIAFVPFEAENFSLGKYMMKVEQMSLTREAYEFWKVIRDQKEGVESLFQPAFGRIATNFTSSTGEPNVIGVFYASAVNTRVTFITSSDAPISVPSPTFEFENNCFYWNSCEKVFENASRNQPFEWE